MSVKVVRDPRGRARTVKVGTAGVVEVKASDASEGLDLVGSAVADLLVQRQALRNVGRSSVLGKESSEGGGVLDGDAT